MAACHENSAWLTNVCAFGRRQKSFHSLSTSHLERFSVWWVFASWQPDLEMCPRLLTAPGWVGGLWTSWVTFSGCSLLPVLSAMLPGTAHLPCPYSNGTDLNCRRPAMLWLCCPWQGRLDLRGIYQLLRCIIDFIIICLHIATPLCSQTTAPKVEWRQSSLNVALLLSHRATRHCSFEACFVDSDQNIDFFKTYSLSELLFLIKGPACRDNWFTGSFVFFVFCAINNTIIVSSAVGSSCKNEDEGTHSFSLDPVNNTYAFIGGFCHVCLMTWLCREI